MAIELVFKVPLLLRNSNGIEKGALGFSILVFIVYFNFLEPFWIWQHLRLQSPEMERIISQYHYQPKVQKLLLLTKLCLFNVKKLLILFNQSRNWIIWTVCVISLYIKKVLLIFHFLKCLSFDNLMFFPPRCLNFLDTKLAQIQCQIFISLWKYNFRRILLFTNFK